MSLSGQSLDQTLDPRLEGFLQAMPKAELRIGFHELDRGLGAHCIGVVEEAF